MKIGMFIKNYATTDFVLHDLTQENPGLGGSQYEMFLLAQLLFEKPINGVEFELILSKPQVTFYKNNFTIIQNIDDVFAYCESNDFDYLILRCNDGINNLSRLNKTKIIYWAHNFFDSTYADIISDSKQVKKIVFVSQEESDFFYDHDIIYKSDVCYNAIPYFDISKIRSSKKENIVLFIGDLSPYKHFDKLTKIWPSIIKKIPDAKLMVIGNGDIYGKNIKFGKRNIAEANYENIIFKPLEENNIENTVEFKGHIKKGIKEIISDAKVTILMNPRETFCIAATDSIASGVKVIAPKSTGYCDVIVNKKTGYLVKNTHKLKNKLIKILKSSNYVINPDDLKYLEKFSPINFYNKWVDILLNIDKSKKPFVKKNLTVDLKWLGILLHFIRKVFHLPNSFSRIGINHKIKKL